MGRFVIIVFAVMLLVFSIFDLIATPRQQVRFLPKPVWFLVLFLAPVGPLLWLFFGHVKPASPPKPNGGWSPPPGPRGPDDDPDYLRGL